MFDGLLYAAFYGFLFAFAVGPVFFTLIETAITKGIKAAIFFEVKNDPGLLSFGGAIVIAYGITSYIRTNKSIFKIVREHYAVTVKKNLGGLFLKGFLLNFVNFGVLAGWIGTLIMANALTTSDNGVFLFITTVLITFFLTDILKMLLAKKLKKKMTPRFIFKTKKWVSILIVAFGVLLLIQGVFPKGVEAGLDKIPGQKHPLEKPIPPVEEPH